MNRFFQTTEDRGFEAPKRVYARLDNADQLGTGERTLTFEAIDADATDRFLQSPAHFIDDGQMAEYATLCAITVGESNLGTAAPKADDSESDDGHWFQFLLDYGYGGPALVYPGLLANPVPAYLLDFALVPAAESSELDRRFSLDPLVAEPPRIEAVLRDRGTISGVTVYDVGQGSAAGLNRHEFPAVYCDFGGGVLAHRASFPEALRSFCFTTRPPVILSHWDWDHWSSGSRFPQALQLPWIAPRQKVGPIHAAFARSLNQGGGLLVWPDELAVFHIGDLCVRKCTGAGRNHSGLAVEVRGPDDQRMLLPGDARYTAIFEKPASSSFLSIVAPHHGADMRSRSVTESMARPYGRIVYSCAESNHFDHPRPITKTDHARAGWPHGNHPGENVARYTFQRSAKGTGHVSLGWNTATPNSRMPCGTRCQLDPQQH